MPERTPPTHRAREILAAVTQAYPHAWQQADHLRQLRGNELPIWPAWCYLPMHGAYAIASGGGEHRVPFERVHHVGIIAALAAWRMGQQIIRYDETLYRSLCATPITGELPTDLLYRLPAWCLYIETPGLIWPVSGEDLPIHGVFVHLDWDQREDRPALPAPKLGGGQGVVARGGRNDHHELRLLLDTCEGDRPLTAEAIFHIRRGLIPVPLILGQGTIEDSFERVVRSGAHEAAKHGKIIPAEMFDAKFLMGTLAPIISLVLYLCSETPDWDLEPPKNPPTVKTKHGPRTFPAAQPRIWDVGVRIGAALRAAEPSTPHSALRTPHSDPASPRPHLRRAHWHTYLTGAGRTKRTLKWLHPILVKAETPDDLPSTIRSITSTTSIKGDPK